MPRLMGILNATPDSFFDQGAYYQLDKAVSRAQELEAQGADILDIGGASSRPGALAIPVEEELNRVVPLLDRLQGVLKIPLSIDSCAPAVVRAALKRGARLINDIRGFQDTEMQQVALESDADLCIMHMPGTPQTMQLSPSYPEGVVPHVTAFFERQVEILTHRGISPNRIILDPGIGFGKTLEHNLALFRALPLFKQLGFPILIGASRKSFLTKLLGKPTTDLLEPTLIVHAFSLLAGADIIRAHDIPPHRDMLTLLTHLQGGRNFISAEERAEAQRTQREKDS
jgi:dihydropteroate synthase